LRKIKGEITPEQAGLQQDEAKQQAILNIAEQQKRAEAEKANEARKIAQAAQEEVDARAHALLVNQQDLDATIEKLAATKQQLIDLKNLTAQTEYISTQYGNFPVPTQAAKQAEQTLASTPFETEIAALEARVESLAKATNGTLYQDLVKSAEALTQAQIAAQQIAAQVTGQVEQIDLKAQEQIIIENTAQMESQAKANADLLRSTFENVQPLNQAQQEGLMLIDRALIDGKLLATEAQDVQKGISLVIANASTNQKINIESTNKLLQLMNSFGATLMNQQKQIDGLQQKYQGIIK